MNRLMGGLLFAVASVGLTSSLYAQDQDGVVRAAPAPVETSQHAARPVPQAAQPVRQRKFQGPTLKRRFSHIFQAGPRYHPPRSTEYYDKTLYPKYIGGFHASHFHNLGVPSGDIGFRGNGFLWTPW